MLYVLAYFIGGICTATRLWLLRDEIQYFDPTEYNRDGSLGLTIFMSLWAWPIMLFNYASNSRELSIFFSGLLGAFLSYHMLFVYHELTLPLEEQLQREKAQLEQEIKDEQLRMEIAKVQADRVRNRGQAVPQEILDKIAKAKRRVEELKRGGERQEDLAQATAELALLRSQGAEYSSRGEAQMGEAPLDSRRVPDSSNTGQKRLILSGLWLGACFFLQRVFEKLFKDKGYALLTVCAAGFLLAFFTANYFLLGGSVTGGLMGAAGDRT